MIHPKAKKLGSILMGFGILTTLTAAYCLQVEEYRMLGVICLLFGVVELYMAVLTLRPKAP